MGTQENKQIVTRWLEAVNSGKNEKILDLLTEDFLFKTMARSPEWLKYRWNKEQFAAAPEAQSTLLESPIRMEQVNLIGDGDLVVLEAQTDAYLKNGKHYDNAYSLIFQLRDGKIEEVREYSCSHLVVECFGEFNPDNPAAARAGKALTD